MSRKNWIIAGVVVLLLAVTAGAAFASGGLDPMLEVAAHSRTRTIVFEVAENGTRFTPDETPVYAEGDFAGMPAFGGEFITQGYLYPEGTLTCHEGACNGVLPDGSPEFPDKVLGTWTCWGFHVGEGAATQTGPWVITTQYYDFGSSYGEESIVTNGYELVDMNVPFRRAIVGGTGPHRAARGEQIQTFLGLNNADQPTFGVALRVELKVRP
jgi:hypothetical protein